MFNEKQKIDSGDNAQNYQAANDITINHGMTYTEVKDVAMMVFKNNFVDLGHEVERLVNERAEKVITDYLKKLMNENPEALDNTKDPDIRYNIFEAQKSYARSGKEDVEKLLVDLLFERTISSGNEMKEIVLNEALTVASKLTKIQLDLLSISFIGRYIRFTAKTHPSIYIQLLGPFEYLFKNNVDKHSDYYYLTYLGCGDISIGSVEFDNMIRGKNIEGFETVESTGENILNYPILNKMKVFWENQNRKIQNMTTTPVGNILAIININNSLGEKVVPLDLAL